MLGYVRKSGFYLLNIVLGAATGLIVIPVLITVVGADTWGYMAVAQATGAIFAVFVGFGWAIVGPAKVAGMDVSTRAQYLRDSLVSRLILFVCAVPVYVVVVLLLLGFKPDIVAFLIAGIIMMSMAVGSGWFFVGESAPGRLVLWEAVPRTIGALIALAVLWSTQSLLLYAIVQLLSVALSIYLTTVDVTRRYTEGVFNRSIRAGFARLSGSYAALVTAGTATFYVNAPLIIVSTIIPAMTPIYAAAEKIQRFTLTAMAPLTQILQGYIPSAADQPAMRKHILRAIALTTVVAIIFGAALSAILPWLAFVLAAGKISVPFSLSIPMGLSAAVILLSGVTGLAALVALGKEKTVALSTVIGALVGLPLTVVLAVTIGLEGAAWAVAFSEVLVLAIQLSTLGRLLTRLR